MSTNSPKETTKLVNEVKGIINLSRENAVRKVDSERTMMYWKIGKRIFEEEQAGKDRADYGKYIIKLLAEKLQPEYGSGFSVRQLERYRQFYRTFSIASALRTQLNWTQYKILLSIENEDKRNFYIAESIKNHWSSRQMERQVNSQLFERLLLSNKKEKVMAVAHKEQFPSEGKEIIKDPMVLEFLGLKQESSYYEQEIETAIISHLQEFLLELGNGFSFMARQKRIHIDGDDFFIDLVFYNRILKCFVIIEIKTEKLTHQHLGQLQMYVNYFDRTEKFLDENKTIGILLCADKNDSVVKFSLPENSDSIIATKYQLGLPSKNQILTELENELRLFLENHN
jgi:predicted nuclease of restriction endonuclease-like (RecB) superfamily